MPLTIPQGIYNIGAVQLNTQPLAALQGKLMAAEEEKQRQLDKYFQSQLSGLNPAGLRADDQIGVANEVNELKNWAQENRKGLQKGDINLKQQFDDKVQSVRNNISYGKQVVGLIGDMNKIRIDPSKGLSQKDNNILNALSYSIYDPRHYKADGSRYSLSDLSGIVPDMNDNDWDRYYNNISRDFEKDTPVGKPTYQTLPNRQILMITQKGYSPNSLKSMADIAAVAVLNDDKLNKYYEYLLRNPTDPRFVAYNEAYNSSGLHPNDKMDDVQKLARAGVYWKFKNQLKREEDRLTSEKPEKESAGNKDTIWNYNPLKNTEELQKTIIIDGTPTRVYLSNDLDPRIKDQFGAQPYHRTEGNYYKIRENGDLEGKGGQVISKERLSKQNAPPAVRYEYERGSSTPAAPKGKRPSLDSFIKK